MAEISASQTGAVNQISGVELQEMRDSISNPEGMLPTNVRHKWFYGKNSKGKPKRKRGLVDTIFTSNFKRVDSVTARQKPLPFLQDTPTNNRKSRHDSMFSNQDLNAGCHSGQGPSDQSSEGSQAIFTTAQEVSHDSSGDRWTGSTLGNVSAVQFAFANAGVDIVFGGSQQDDLMDLDEGIETNSEYKQRFSLNPVPSPKSEDASNRLRILKTRKGFATKPKHASDCQCEDPSSQYCDLKLKTPVFDTCITGMQVQKRPADLDDDATSDHYHVEDDSDHVQASKKPRLEDHHSTQSTCPSINDCEVTSPVIEEPCTNTTTNNDEPLVSPSLLSDGTICDYPGRFESPESDALKRFKISSPSENPFVMGDAIHPHSTIVHTNFIPDPSWEVLDYDQVTLDYGPRLRKAS
ncbi:hypothetical protein PV10_04763 [Exophiala mesophila]|uniref:Uncharacterized protein n=1 Tax=Exophiala mesophila TaxID=212818 RepID=A0A0D1XZA5_EXOME|nr:uncharacterized protein PV10_04763 [Exophiala mesophila]KIV93556.1 hypothetical protein PV10_04763 [Exophiala mesophila]